MHAAGCHKDGHASFSALLMFPAQMQSLIQQGFCMHCALFHQDDSPFQSKLGAIIFGFVAAVVTREQLGLMALLDLLRSWHLDPSFLHVLKVL